VSGTDANLAVNMPQAGGAIVNATTGTPTGYFYQFLQTLWLRTGSAQGESAGNASQDAAEALASAQAAQVAASGAVSTANAAELAAGTAQTTANNAQTSATAANALAANAELLGVFAL
jgi:hypothetical protein